MFESSPLKISIGYSEKFKLTQNINYIFKMNYYLNNKMCNEELGFEVKLDGASNRPLTLIDFNQSNTTYELNQWNEKRVCFNSWNDNYTVKNVFN